MRSWGSGKGETGRAQSLINRYLSLMKSPRKPGIAAFIWDWSKTIAVAFIIWLGVRSFVLEAFHIPSGSMEKTLLIGDVLWVNKALYGAEVPFVHKRLPAFREPRRLDIVVFWSVTEPGLHVVKRVIGMPGDTLSMEDNVTFLNGKALDEPYVIKTHPEFDDGHKTWGPLVVPPDSFLVMGDNRDDSMDSRYWGFLGRDRIIGSPMMIYYSWDPQGVLPLPFFTAIRWGRLFTAPD
jgi:signal peptidase I